MSRNENEKSSILRSANAVNVITILVITAVGAALILLLSKSIFSSNSKEVPVGIDTATIAHTVTTPATTAAAQSAAAVTTVPAEVTEPVPEGPEYAYIVTYVQLLKEAQEGSGNLICMSPNIKVEVHERRPDGFCKVSFLNGDGTVYTGYVLSEYLSPVQIDRNAANPLEGIGDEPDEDSQPEPDAQPAQQPGPVIQPAEEKPADAQN